MDNAIVNFETWCQEWHPRLVASIVAMFGDVDLATETADEAVVRAFERWDQVSVMASPEGWSHRVVVNVARRRLRRRAFETQVLRRDRAKTTPPPAGELWPIVATVTERARLRHRRGQFRRGGALLAVAALAGGIVVGLQRRDQGPQTLIAAEQSESARLTPAERPVTSEAPATGGATPTPEPVEPAAARCGTRGGGRGADSALHR